MNQDSNFEWKGQQVPIVYEDIHLEILQNESHSKGINKLKQSDNSRTNARSKTTADGGIGKQRSLDRTSTVRSKVSQDESRGITISVYVVEDSNVSSLNEKRFLLGIKINHESTYFPMLQRGFPEYVVLQFFLGASLQTSIFSPFLIHNSYRLSFVMQ